MSEERYKLIKENVYTRCYIAEHSGIGLTFPDKEEIELIDYVEELKDQLQQKENIIKEVRNWVKSTIDIIKQQPTGNDDWILERLNSFISLLDKGSDKE